MKKLLMILGVAGLLAGCDLMNKPADDAMTENTVAPMSADASGTHTNSQEQDQDQDHTQGSN